MDKKLSIAYVDEINALKKVVLNWKSSDFFNQSEKKRDKDWSLLDGKVNSLCEKYAWAVPDERALRIISYFSPIVEMGAGKGYWASLLRNRGVDIIAFDKYIDLDSCFTPVERGGPEEIARKKKTLKGRTLFLCYPDEAQVLQMFITKSMLTDENSTNFTLK